MSKGKWIAAGVVIAVAAVLAIGLVALAGEEKAPYARAAAPPACGGGMMPGGMGMMPGGMGMMGMCPMHGGMMGGMMGRAAITAADGAVYVLAGNKVLKYDRDLNLQKEAEIEVDMPRLNAMTRQMMKQCPMRQQMMRRGPAADDDDNEDEEDDD